MTRPTKDIAINGRFLTQTITGVQRYGHELLRALDRLLPEFPEVRIALVCPRFDGPLPRLSNIAIEQGGRFSGHAWEQVDLPALSRGRILFCPGNTAPAASLLSGQKTVACVHDLSYLYFPAAYGRAFRLVYNTLIPLIFRRAKAVITVSEAERLSIGRRYPFVRDRLVAIQNGGLSDDMAPVPAALPDDRTVLYVGSLSKRKNFPNMFAAACRMARERNYRFVFVGGTAAGLVSSGLSVPADLQDRIHFAGQVDDTAALIRHYRSASVFMFPSFYEASPLPPVEAMACGCPVVSSPIPSLTERCGDAALYCDPHDVDDIAAKVGELMESAELRAVYRAKGLERAGRFTWAQCARRTLEVLRGV